MFYMMQFDCMMKKLFHKILSVEVSKNQWNTIQELPKDVYESSSTDFPSETFVKIGRKLSQDNIYYSENKEYVILYKNTNLCFHR